MEKLASKERILRTVAGQPVDRIPIFAPVPWHRLAPEPDPKNWKASPNYQQLLPLVAEHCDFMGTSEVTVSPVDDRPRDNIIAYIETAARYAPFKRDRNGA